MYNMNEMSAKCRSKMEMIHKNLFILHGTFRYLSCIQEFQELNENISLDLVFNRMTIDTKNLFVSLYDVTPSRDMCDCGYMSFSELDFIDCIPNIDEDKEVVIHVDAIITLRCFNGDVHKILWTF